MVPSILEGDGLGAGIPPAVAEEVTGPGPLEELRVDKGGAREAVGPEVDVVHGAPAPVGHRHLKHRVDPAGHFPGVGLLDADARRRTPPAFHCRYPE